MNKNKKKLRKEIEKLILSGNYDAIQIIRQGQEEPYDGCVHNLFRILSSEDEDTVVEKIEDTNPLCRQGHNTYRLAFSMWGDIYQIVIWDLDTNE